MYDQSFKYYVFYPHTHTQPTHTHPPLPLPPHTQTAQNVLVFDGGRTVKLTDFGTAIAVGEATATLKGWTPYFVAPEIVKGEVPHFSADIWSVMCILVEMLTAKWPGCHRVTADNMNEMAMMFLVS